MLRTPAIRMPWSVPVASMLKPSSLYCSRPGGVGRHEAQALLVLAAGGHDAFDGVDKHGIVELARDAKEVRQIEMAEPQDVDARQRRNGLHMFDSRARSRSGR